MNNGLLGSTCGDLLVGIVGLKLFKSFNWLVVVCDTWLVASLFSWIIFLKSLLVGILFSSKVILKGEVVIIWFSILNFYFFLWEIGRNSWMS